MPAAPPEPAITIGLATILGLAGSGAAAAVPLVQWLAGLDTSHAPIYAGLAGALAAITQLGRYAQAARRGGPGGYRGPDAGVSAPAPGPSTIDRSGAS